MIGEMSHLTVGEILEKAIGIEQKVADLYQVLTKRFSHVPGMSSFWDDLRNDELNHAKTLQSVYKSLPEAKLASRETRSISDTVNTILKSLDRDILGQIKTLDDAYEIAYELEFSEINALFKYLTIDIVSTTSRGEIIVRHIDEHQQKLMNFGQYYGGKEWRSRFQIQPG